MADVLSEYQRQVIEWHLKLSSEFPLEYVRREAALQYDFLCCVEIPWPLLRKWSELLEFTSGAEINYIDLLNATVVDGWFALKRENERMNELLRKKASAAKISYKKTSGRKRKELDSKTYSLCVRRGELESVESLKSEVLDSYKEIQEWRKAYSDLANEKKKLFEEMKKEINKQEEEITNLTDVNKDLVDYIEALEQRESLKCQGKKVTEVGTKQKGRKLRHLKNKVQCALWFCKSFGLEITQLKLQDEKGGAHTLDWEPTPTDGDYENLHKEDKKKLEQVLFLLDKFCVGDEVYHELTMITEDLPKSYLVKQLRGNLNKIYHIEQTQGKYPGAKINFTATLEEHVKELLNNKPELKDGCIDIKISGDGARMSRTTNFMMFSFALLQAKESIMSSKSNRTVAIINGPEKYETMKTSLKHFFKEVNELIEKGQITVDGKDIDINFFLGGDMKFLLMVMGMNSATADYACLWCKIHKDNRWDTTKLSNYYNQQPLQRTLEEIKKLCKCKENNYGCINEPLLNIPLTNVIADELHLLLRITDKLLQNVIDEVLEKDAVEDFNKKRGIPKGVHLTKLVNCINSLGISFSVWNKKNADGSESQVKEFTSLLGSQKKKLLNGLPSKMNQFLYPETCETVKQIWTDFEELYNTITDLNISGNDSASIFTKAQSWINLFCSLRGKRSGYERPRVTPYMHIIPYHIPYFIEKHGCFKKFSGQGVEKNNDDAKRILFQKSNKWEAAKDILNTESRQWDLRHCEREKAIYTKRNVEYWETGIGQKRKEQRLMSAPSSSFDEEMCEESFTEDYSKMTVPQLRELIKEKGLKVKNLSKLRKKELLTIIENS